jgi:hypothetical protein
MISVTIITTYCVLGLKPRTFVINLTWHYGELHHVFDGVAVTQRFWFGWFDCGGARLTQSALWRGSASFWRWKSRKWTGRPSIGRWLAELIQRMSTDNSL